MHDGYNNTLQERQRLKDAQEASFISFRYREAKDEYEEFIFLTESINYLRSMVQAEGGSTS